MLKRVLKKVSSVIAALFLMVVAFVTSVPTSELAQAATVKNGFDSTSVESDFGEDFNWLLYPENKLGKIDVLQFVEYCYTDDVSEKGNYGLYLYVYNPALLRFSANNNVVNMAVAYDENGNPSEYSNVPLLLCGYSHGDYAFRVYKFRISLPSSVYVSARSCNQKNGYRQYDIASIQLRVVGETLSQDNKVARAYRCSGYAKGYDETSMQESTYACTWEDLETLTLDVKSTFYRPEGTNDKSDFTQDTLHSVYFAVPNDTLEEYGRLSAVHATWLNAVLNPGLVTGNLTAYNEINKFLGVKLDDWDEDDLDFIYIGACEPVLVYQSGAYSYNHGFVYNWTYDPSNLLVNKYLGEKIDTLYLNFYAGSDIDSADNYTLSSEYLLAEMENSLSKYGGDAVNGKYSSNIFESVDSEFTDITIKADENFSLTSQVISNNFWEKLFGVSQTTVFDGIEAIHAVTENDVKGSVEDVSNRLYISQSDYVDFMAFYTAQTLLDKTVYLFRYQVSDYVSQEATLMNVKPDSISGFWDKIDTNAYFFQETVNLDFDIIDLTFSKEDDYKVIPVVSDPIDVVHDATPPTHTTSDEDPDWWKIILGALLLVVIVFAIISWGPPLLKSLFKGIGKGLSAVFNGIRRFFKRLFSRRR